MLQHLSIRDFALVEALDLDLPRGLVAVTGETGAGKSIVFDAVALLLGGRASSDVVRSGATEASIRALFTASGAARAAVDGMLAEAGIPSGDALIVRRVVSRSGPNRVWVNDTLATVGLLERLLAPLVDLLGQHQHLALLRPDTQRALVDEFGELGDDVLKMRALYDEWSGARRRREELETAEADRAQRLEFLRFQAREIEALGPRDGEYDALSQRLVRIRNAGRLCEHLGAAAGALAEREPAASGRVGEAAAALSRAATLDGSLRPLSDRCVELRVLLDDLASDVARIMESVGDAEEADVLESRHEAYRRLARRLGVAPEALGDRAASLRAEIDGLENFGESLARASREERDALAAAAAHAARLTKARRAAGRRLVSRTEKFLRQLGMPDAKLELHLTERPPEKLAVHGADDFELRFSANRGESPRSLARVASGGELSRLMLAVKTAAIEADAVETCIFDEVDSGVGGATAAVLGRLLRDLGRSRQVLCVTHLPQIAAFADSQLGVSKRAERDRTSSRVESLSGDRRVEEIARMLGGTELAGTTREHARVLLASAQAG